MENIAHRWSLHREDVTACHLAAEIRKSSHVPSVSPAPALPRVSRVPKIEGKTSTAASIAFIEDPFTYAKAIESSQRCYWTRAMEEENCSILLNNPFSALKSREARQQHVMLIVSKWVYKSKHNTDGSTYYKAQLVINIYPQPDFGESNCSVGKLTTFHYLICLIKKLNKNMDPLDAVTTFLNCEIENDDIYITLAERWVDGLNSPKIIVRLRKAFNNFKQAPRLWHADINALLLSHVFTQSSAEPNPYLRRDSILIPVHVNHISWAFQKDFAIAAIELKAKLWEQYMIARISQACQFRPSRSTTMNIVPELLTVRLSISSPFPDDLAWSIVTMSQHPLILMNSWTWSRIRW
jgi:hypothetical protein